MSAFCDWTVSCFLHQVCYHCLADLDSHEASDAGSGICDTDVDVDVDESPSTVASTCQPRFCSSGCRDMAVVRCASYFHSELLMCSKLHVPSVYVFVGPDSSHLLRSRAPLPRSHDTAFTFSELSSLPSQMWCAGELLRCGIRR